MAPHNAPSLQPKPSCCPEPGPEPPCLRSWFGDLLGASQAGRTTDPPSAPSGNGVFPNLHEGLERSGWGGRFGPAPLSPKDSYMSTLQLH